MRIATGEPIDPALFGFKGVFSPVTGISTDSREIRRGDLFVALKGEKSDGAEYIPEAFSLGAALVLSHRRLDDPRVLTADDPIGALFRAAELYAATIPHRTVGITGSYGKTTLRHNLTSILSAAFPVAFTSGNGNTDLSVALTLLSASRDARMLIAELGMRGRGEISRLSRLIKPDLSVITAIGSAHLGLLGSKDEIAAAKCEIADGMKRESTLLYPANEPLLAARVTTLPVRVASVSTDPSVPATYALIPEETAFGKTIVSLRSPKGIMSGVTLPDGAAPTLFSAAFCFAVCEELGIDRKITRSGLSRLSSPPLRRQFEQIGGVTVVLDCYNASPEPTIEALRSLKGACDGKRRLLLVLGDMRELGDNAAALHREVGRAAAQLEPDRLFCVGDLSEEYAAGAIDAGLSMERVETYSADAVPELSERIAAETAPGDLLFLKGSRALALERIAERLKRAEKRPRKGNVAKATGE